MPTMIARYPGTCAVSGRRFQAGARIDYDRRSKTAVLVEADAEAEDAGVNLAARTRAAGYVSNVFSVGGREYYRNKRGRCEDAPCCGCCTI